MNIYEIAEKAGVSIATVSRVINNTGGVKKETRDKIKEIISSTGFIKKSEVKRRRTNTIAVVCTSLNGINSIMVSHICTGLNNLNFRTELLCSGDNIRDKRKILEKITYENNLGLIILGSDFFTYSDEDNDSLLLRISLPVVIINGFCENPLVNNVENSISESIFSTVSYYLKKGCEKILLLLEHMSSGSKEFLKGYNKAFFLCRLETAPDYIQVCRDTEAVEKYIKKLINKNMLPDVIISDSDIMASAATRYLIQKGYSVPSDTEIISCGNTHCCRLISPSLSAFDLKLSDLCTTAVKNITGIINKEEVPDINIITPEFIKRESTK